MIVVCSNASFCYLCMYLIVEIEQVRIETGAIEVEITKKKTRCENLSHYGARLLTL